MNENNNSQEFEYTDDEASQENNIQVALENDYYNAKGLKEQQSSLAEVVRAFENVIQKEQEDLKQQQPPSPYTFGPWSYKALKQIIKVYLREATGSTNNSSTTQSILNYYNQLLNCIDHGNVSPNAVEKGINGMLERVASLYQANATLDPVFFLHLYEDTLQVFHPHTGKKPNERLWLKTNIKYGQLLYEMNQIDKLERVVMHDLQQNTNITPSSSSQLYNNSQSASSSTQSMEIYALQIQLYYKKTDHRRLRETFHKAMSVRGGIPHPRTMALIQEMGGKMHMKARDYEQAEKNFFQAFKSYDEAGDHSRLRCLKYLVLASMLHASSINPFDSQEARPYRDDPEIVVMTNLVQAFHNNNIESFERILRQNKTKIMSDEFVREHIEDLLRTIRTQVMRQIIRPYNRISLQAIARELNNIPVSDVESLLVSLILDGSLDGKIDKVDGILVKEAEIGNATPSSGSHNVSRQNIDTREKTVHEQKVEAMEKLIHMLGSFSSVAMGKVSDPLRTPGGSLGVQIDES